jgi:hypothetical protein
MERGFLVAWVVLLSFGLSARSYARPRFGAFAGGQCDAPAVEDVERFDSSCSMVPFFGLLTLFDGPRSLGLEGRAAYSGRSFSSTAFVTETPVRMRLVELAFFALVPIHETSGGFRFTALAGPEVGFVLEVHRRFRDVDQDITEELRPADFRLRGALRVSRQIGSFDIFFQGGLAWGLTDLDDTNQQQIHSRAVLFEVGVTR